MKAKNIGWLCIHCGFFLTGKPGRSHGFTVAELVMRHIRVKHPIQWSTGNWRIRPLKQNELEG